MGGLKKITRNLRQGRQDPSSDTNQEPIKYKSTMLLLEQTFSVMQSNIINIYKANFNYVPEDRNFLIQYQQTGDWLAPELVSTRCKE